MLEAAATALRFCCPECGAGMAAPRADRGRTLCCHRCGLPVRVPTRPHPLESDAAPDPLITPSAAANAASGIGLLTLSLRVALFEHTFLIAAGCVWLGHVGVAGVLSRDLGRLGPLLAAAWVLDLALLSVRTRLRWVGYGRCRSAAAAVGADGWVTAAQMATLTRWAGWLVVPAPWALGWSASELRPEVQTVVAVGFLAWAAGTAAEFGILTVWHRLLIEAAGQQATASVTRYLLALGGTAVAVPAGLSLLGMTVGLTARPGASPLHPRSAPAVRLEDLPPDAWYAVGGFLAGLAVLGLLIGIRYLKVLTAVRAGLTGR